MRHFLTILSHEIRMLLFNPSTYVAAVLFLGFMGFVFATMLEGFSKAPQETSPAYSFFYFFPIPILIMVPLLTMRCLAEERRLGTIETLLTTPVTTTEVVLGKYSAAYFLYVMLWASTGAFFYLLNSFAGNSGLLDAGPLVGGYLFMLVSGLLYISVGVFSSSMFRNQAVAGIFATTLLFVLIFGIHYIARIPLLQGDSFQGLQATLDSAQVLNHFNDFTRGIIDSRQIIFYLSGTALMLIFSILSVEARLLHG